MSRIALAITCLLLAPACTGDDDPDTTVGSTDSTSTGTSAGSGSGSTTDDSTSGTSNASSSTTTTTTASTTSTSSSTTSTSGGANCPEDPNDNACIACVKPTCCDFYLQCRADEICSCTLDCVLEGKSLGSCGSTCGGQNDLYKALYFCGQQTCLGTCDWPKPSGG